MIGSRLLLLACLLGCGCACYGASLRGVDPKLRTSYAAVDGRFTCLDGLKTIPFDRVNDDYCDCFDGSDEPGTAACPNGKFYCRNAGFEPLRLNASFVDDGVCDCCDGSDEAAVKCPNTCKEKGAESIKALKAEVAAAEAGVKAKERYISQASGIKKGWQQRLSALEGEIEKQQKLVDELAAKRDAIQEEERKAEEARKQAEEERKRKEEEEAAARQAAEAAAAQGQPPAAEAAEGEGQQAQQAAGGAGEGAGQDGQQPQGEGSGIGAAAEAESKEEESAEELAKRVAAQWIPGANREEEKPAAAEGQGGEEDGGDGDAEGVGAAGAQDYGQDFVGEDGDDELGGGGGNDEDEEPAGEEEEEEFIPDIPSPTADAPAADEDRPRKQLRPLPQWANKAVKWGKNLLSKVTGKPASDGTDGTADESSEGSDLDSLRKRLADARSAVTSASGKLRDLNKEKKGLEEAVKREYGPQDEFVALADKCFETQVDKYTYEVCPFAKANQKEGPGSTFLGNWGGFGDNHSSLRFKGGMSCWQGPQRSITVSLVCGSSEELSKVEEPSRCEYAAQLTTPAACSGEALQALRVRLDAKMRALEGEESHDEL